MVQLILVLWLSACAALASTNEQQRWRSLLLDLADRREATRYGTNDWAVPPVAAVNTLRIPLGNIPYATNCWTNGGVSVCVTNYRLESALIGATNMLADTPSNLLAAYAGLAVAFTSGAPDASIVWQADESIFALLDSGRWVDTIAVSNAGGVDAYLNSYTSTNWYWVDTDTNYAGDTWWPFPQHPMSLPVLTRSNAWARAGLEGIPVEMVIETNTLTNLVYGWEVGDLDAYQVTNVLSAPRTNLVYLYAFTRSPSQTSFRAETGRAQVRSVSEWAVTSVVAGVTSVVWWTSNRLVNIGVPAQPPNLHVPPRLLTNATAWLEFSRPRTNADFSGLGGTVTGHHAVVHPYLGTTQAWESFTWGDSTSRYPLAHSYVSGVVFQADWSAVEVKGSPTSLLGAAVSMIYTAPVYATIGPWWTNSPYFAAPTWGGHWSQRVAILKQLRWTQIEADNSPQVSWISTSNEFVNVNWHKYAFRRERWLTQPPGCGLTSISLETEDLPFTDGYDPCAGEGGLSERPSISPGDGIRTDPYPPMWEGQISRMCSSARHEDFSSQVRDFLYPDPGQCDPETDQQEEAGEELEFDVSGFAAHGWPIDLAVIVSNLSPVLSCEVEFVSGLGRVWYQTRDRIASSGLLDYAIPYDAADQVGTILSFAVEPPLPYEYRYRYQIKVTDTNDDGDVFFDAVWMTNVTMIVSNGLPPATNRLAVVFSAAKGTGVTAVTVSAPSVWPSSPLAASVEDEYTYALTGDETMTAINDTGWITTTTHSERSEAGHYYRARDVASAIGHDEGNSRFVLDPSALFRWKFADRAAALQ